MAKTKTKTKKKKSWEEENAEVMAKRIAAAAKYKPGGAGTKGRHVYTMEGPEATRRGRKEPDPRTLKGLAKIITSPLGSRALKVIPSKPFNIITRKGEGGEETDPGGSATYLKRAKKMMHGGIMKAGKEYSVEEVGDETYGIDEIPTEWGRKKLNKGTEQLIKGSEFQVRGRYFNNNNGKGTF